MKTPLILVALLLCTPLSGCLAAVAYGVGQAEAERLSQLEKWEAGLVRLDCPQLDTVFAELTAEKDSLVDHDQREDILREQMTAKQCPLPEGLS